MLDINWNDFFRRHPVTPQVDDDYLMVEENEKPFPHGGHYDDIEEE